MLLPNAFLLADLQNLIIRLGVLGLLLDLEELMALAGPYRLRIWAYGDPSCLSDSLAKDLDVVGGRFIGVRTRRRDGTPIPDAVDRILAGDFIELGLTQPGLRELVLAGGDGHYLNAVNIVQRHGVTVRVIAVPGSLSLRLGKAVGGRVSLLTGSSPRVWGRCKSPRLVPGKGLSVRPSVGSRKSLSASGGDYGRLSLWRNQGERRPCV